MFHRSLNAIFLPEGHLSLEWENVEEPLERNQIVLQDELYSLFKSDYNTFLYFLGFSNENIPLSPGLDFFRGYIALFIRKLI